ncbi:MAG: sigma factor, partial [Gemmatimonadota bacterium]
MDPRSLVSAHLAGDSTAFGELFRRYSERLLNFINRVIRDRERSEDLVQETFVRIHRHLHRFDQSR